MKYIKLILIFLISTFIGCNNEPTVTTCPNADAVYLNLTKTFILNEDGSIVQKVEKEHKLLTYRAFQSLYGDTRIVYNPEFQQLQVDESYTIMADGTNVPTPENGYNEVLPRYATNSKVHNHLREMVVTHTGLERGSTIKCSYEIFNKVGALPFLMGNEVLSTTCPIEKLQIVVKVPSGKSLNYELFNVEQEASVKKGAEFVTYTWKFEDIAQHNHEKLEPAYNSKLPRLVFSTQQNLEEAVQLLIGSDAFHQEINPSVAKQLTSAIEGNGSDILKALEVQRIVVEDMNLLNVPQSITMFQYREAQQVWESNSGTAIEKSVLMASMLKSLGQKAEVCLNIPNELQKENLPFLLEATPFVKVDLEGEISLSLSPTHLNKNASEFEKNNYSILSLSSNSTMNVDKSKPGEISILGSLDLEIDKKVSVTLQGKFSNSCNPYYNLQRKNSAAGIIKGIGGDIVSSSSELSEVHFKGQTDKLVKESGGYFFFTIPISGMGISSKGLASLPMEHLSNVEFGNPLNETYEITVHIQDGLEFINDELSSEISTPIGSLNIKIVATGKTVKILKKLEITKAQIDSENYNDFRNLINTWNLKKFNQLVFRKTS